MVNKKRIKNYLDKQLHGMQNNLKQMSKEVEKEMLHDLRLHAKKAKAVSGFLQATLHNKDKYTLKELKELFDTAGDIRTAQLNLETVESLKIKSEVFEKEQKVVIEKDSKTIVRANKRFNKDISSLRKKIRKNLRKIKNNSAVLFYYDNIKSLSNYLKIINERKLHDSRKIIKKLLYNLKILPLSLGQKININKEYLDNLQDLIGKWHDAEVTLEMLTHSGNVDSQDLDVLIKQKLEHLEKIVHATRDFDTYVMFAKPA